MIIKYFFLILAIVSCHGDEQQGLSLDEATEILSIIAPEGSSTVDSIGGFEFVTDTIDNFIVLQITEEPTYTSTHEPLHTLMTIVYDQRTKKQFEIINDFDKEVWNVSSDSCVGSQTEKVLRLEDTFNRMINYLEISDIGTMSRILDYCLGTRLFHYQEFQYDKYIRIARSKGTTDSKCCLQSIASNTSKIVHGIYNENMDVYETQLRGVFIVGYKINDRKIGLEYLLGECNRSLRLSFVPYQVQLEEDALLLPDMYKSN